MSWNEGPNKNPLETIHILRHTHVGLPDKNGCSIPSPVHEDPQDGWAVDSIPGTSCFIQEFYLWNKQLKRANDDDNDDDNDNNNNGTSVFSTGLQWNTTEHWQGITGMWDQGKSSQKPRWPPWHWLPLHVFCQRVHLVVFSRYQFCHEKEPYDCMMVKFCGIWNDFFDWHQHGTKHVVSRANKWSYILLKERTECSFIFFPTQSSPFLHFTINAVLALQRHRLIAYFSNRLYLTKISTLNVYSLPLSEQAQHLRPWRWCACQGEVKWPLTHWPCLLRIEPEEFWAPASYPGRFSQTQQITRVI